MNCSCNPYGAMPEDAVLLASADENEQLAIDAAANALKTAKEK